MSDINASLAFSQLNKINKFMKKRNFLANIYSKKLSSLIDLVKIIKSPDNSISSYHLLILYINFKKLKINKDKFIKIMNEKKIYPQYHYIPIYNFSYYNYLKRGQKFKCSEKYYESAISMPIYYDLSTKNLMKIIKSVKDILSRYIK